MGIVFDLSIFKGGQIWKIYSSYLKKCRLNYVKDVTE